VPLLVMFTSAARERARNNRCVPFSRKCGTSLAWNTSPLKLFVTDRQTEVWTQLPPVSPVRWNKSIPDHNDVKMPQGLLHKLTFNKMLRVEVSFCNVCFRQFYYETLHDSRTNSCTYGPDFISKKSENNQTAVRRDVRQAWAMDVNTINKHSVTVKSRWSSSLGFHEG